MLTWVVQLAFLLEGWAVSLPLPVAYVAPSVPTEERPEGAPIADNGRLVWRNAQDCGPNALFAFLQCHGVNRDLGDVRAQVDLCERGCSLADLQRASERFGLAAQTVEIDLRGLRATALPAIALLDALDENYGHFMVVAEVADDSVTVLDPITTVVARVDLGTFQRTWTGYALIARRESAIGIAASSARWTLIGLSTVVAMGVVWGLIKRVRAGRTAIDK